MIEIREYISQKPNGDRATRTVPCSKFEVRIIKGEKQFTAFTHDCFDSYRVSVGNLAHGQQAAVEYARNLAEVLGHTGDIPHKRFVEKIISTTEWVEQ